MNWGIGCSAVCPPPAEDKRPALLQTTEADFKVTITIIFVLAVGPFRHSFAASSGGIQGRESSEATTGWTKLKPCVAVA